MQQGMDNNSQKKGHLQPKLLEPGMRGNTLQNSSFHPSHKLVSQGQVPEECGSAQPLSSLGKTCSPVAYEESKNQKKAKLASGSHPSPNFAPPFSSMLELQEMSYGHAFQRLDLHSQCSLNMPQFRRISDNPNAAHPVPYVPVCATVRPGGDFLESSSLSHQLVGCCHQNSPKCTALGDSGRITVLYVELIRELERQMAELRRTLASREEAATKQEKRIQELELENRELKDLLQNLEEQNDFLSIRNGAGGTVPARMLLGTRHNSFDVNESNIQFLKDLVGMLENLATTQENGRVKLELVPNSQVYITHHQLEDLSQVSTDKPELMTRRLLDYFFSRETLARSSATGQRIAHNNLTMEKPIPLPVAVVNAIKEYVTKTCGRGCNFNAVINSKCGTSRRAVKKMIVKMD
ncbi:uncharacterized protein LOC128332154 isoform X4 [Hemicordylus capensis]|uniref:uncharacterized protein LOC128332154 isoform X4 n=1 Tax=Hemicordylus capensis TaxID=884348 RepID=UPI0023034DF7|nr:uncharacterized protein LOC128332154 isoform X4 [Hemicordylus capensis]